MNKFFDFNDFTLTDQQIYHAGGVSLAILAVIVVMALAIFGNEEKKLAWSLSMVNSGIMSLIGIVYLVEKLPSYPRFFFLGDNGIRPFHGLNNVAVLVNIWFALANIVDLLFGMIFYPRFLGLLTAYIHHSVFIWIMWTSATGNGFFLQATPFAPAFSLMLIEEIPTFLLAVGSIFPSLRTDVGFGLTFFLLRICYHSYVFAYAIYSGVEVVALVLYTLTLALHIFWFYGWFTKYSGIGGKSKKEFKPKSI